MSGYEGTLDALQEKFKSFVVEATAGQKNQAAALRARKLSMELRNDMKDFRTSSVNNDDEIRKARKESK